MVSRRGSNQSQAIEPGFNGDPSRSGSLKLKWLRFHCSGIALQKLTGLPLSSAFNIQHNLVIYLFKVESEHRIVHRSPFLFQ